MKPIINAAIAISLILCAAAPAIAQERHKVAVYMSGKNQTQAQSEIVAFALTDALSKSKNFVATERTKDFLSTISKENLYQFSGAVDNSQIAALGKKSGVGYVCVAELVNLSEFFQGSKESLITARFINVESAVIEGSDYRIAVIANEEAILSVSQDIAQGLIGDFDRRDNSAQLEQAAIYSASNGRDAVDRILLPLLTHEVSRSGKYAVSERTGSFLETLSQELGHQYSGSVDDKQLTKLGIQSGVKYVIAIKSAGRVVNIRSIDVTTGDIANSESGTIDYADVASIERSVSGLIGKFLEGGASAAASEQAAVLTPESAPKSAMESVSGSTQQQKQEQSAEQGEAQGTYRRSGRGRVVIETEEQRRFKEEKEEQTRLKKELREERLAKVPLKKIAYGVDMGLSFPIEYGSGDEIFLGEIGISSILFIHKYIQFIPQINYMYGYYEIGWYSTIGKKNFQGVGLPLLFQFSTDYRRKVVLFVESGVEFIWLIDEDSYSIFNMGFPIGAGVAIGRRVYVDVIKWKISSGPYHAPSVGVRVLF